MNNHPLETVYFVLYSLAVLFVGLMLGLWAFWPPYPDPGYGYKWKCNGEKVVIKVDSKDNPFMSGNLCKRIKK